MIMGVDMEWEWGEQSICRVSHRTVSGQFTCVRLYQPIAFVALAMRTTVRAAQRDKLPHVLLENLDQRWWQNIHSTQPNQTRELSVFTCIPPSSPISILTKQAPCLVGYPPRLSAARKLGLKYPLFNNVVGS